MQFLDKKIIETVIIWFISNACDVTRNGIKAEKLKFKRIPTDWGFSEAPSNSLIESRRIPIYRWFCNALYPSYAEQSLVNNFSIRIRVVNSRLPWSFACDKQRLILIFEHSLMQNNFGINVAASYKRWKIVRIAASRRFPPFPVTSLKDFCIFRRLPASAPNDFD